MRSHPKPIKVTISDPETGTILEETILKNDYAIITAGNRYVKNIQVMGRTHMLAVAVQPTSPQGASHDG